MLNLSTFKNQLYSLNKDYRNKRYLLAVSGGVDSMVLLYLFNELKLNFQVAHINYKLRGNDSDLDQALVENFCKVNNIKFHFYSVSKKDEKPENSIQEWARDIRYLFFNKIKQQEGLDKLVTAHHLNDNVETFLIHLSRGSGIKGLCGIPENENTIIRPLLTFKKSDCYAFAKEHFIQFREDISNKKNDYLRNQFRNLILPEIEKVQPKFIENTKKSVQYLNDAQKFIEDQIQEIKKEITISKKDNILIFDKNKLANKTSFIQFEILKKFGFNSTKEIEKIFTAETGKSFFSSSHQLLINREELEIRKNNTQTTEEEKIILAKNEEAISSLNYRIKLSNFIGIDEAFSWELDLDKITFPIYLRKRKEGDIFHPSGFNGKKKVSKFYKDKKLSIFAKENYWILCDNIKILGLPPFRQDRRTKTNNKTTKTVSITN